MNMTERKRADQLIDESVARIKATINGNVDVPVPAVLTNALDKLKRDAKARGFAVNLITYSKPIAAREDHPAVMAQRKAAADKRNALATWAAKLHRDVWSGSITMETLAHALDKREQEAGL